MQLQLFHCLFDFNPLSPCGERQIGHMTLSLREKFQPTLPVWGETAETLIKQLYITISTHSPRVGRDLQRKEMAIVGILFQPTLPVWGETYKGFKWRGLNEFQPTLPVWGETQIRLIVSAADKFQPTLPVWGETP